MLNSLNPYNNLFRQGLPHSEEKNKSTKGLNNLPRLTQLASVEGSRIASGKCVSRSILLTNIHTA